MLDEELELSWGGGGGGGGGVCCVVELELVLVLDVELVPSCGGGGGGGIRCVLLPLDEESELSWGGGGGGGICWVEFVDDDPQAEEPQALFVGDDPQELLPWLLLNMFGLYAGFESLACRSVENVAFASTGRASKDCVFPW